MSDEVVTVKDASIALGVHVNTIRNWIADGTLQSARVGRFHRPLRSEIERLLPAARVVDIAEVLDRRADQFQAEAERLRTAAELLRDAR